jgi:phosphatidylglycerophosphatase A
VIVLLEQDKAIRSVALGTPQGLLAFGFGSGLSRYAPGTVGTIAAIPFALLLGFLPAVFYWPVLILLFLLGIYVCGISATRLGKHDPGGIVWDEMVAYWLVVAFLPAQWTWWLAAFVLFRFFDILKPWPIRQSEKAFKGGLGIMIDDIIAALYAIAILVLFQRWDEITFLSA